MHEGTAGERANVCLCVNESVCVHPGPQDHSVAIVTSTIRTQEAKAWDLRESDGVRLRNEMSYVSVCASVCLSHGVLCCSKLERLYVERMRKDAYLFYHVYTNMNCLFQAVNAALCL